VKEYDIYFRGEWRGYIRARSAPRAIRRYRHNYHQYRYRLIFESSGGNEYRYGPESPEKHTRLGRRGEGKRRYALKAIEIAQEICGG